MAPGKFPKGIIIILLLGLGLRLINLDQSFWLDEASQARMSSLSLSQIWSGRSGDFHPPLYYVFAHFWMQFGHSEVWLRLPSVIFGVLNIYLIYVFAQKIFPDKKIENLAGILLAISPFHIYYSQEFRSYSLLCLLGTWSMYLLFTKKYFWLILADALLLYTHYSSVFLIITQLIYVVIYQKPDLKKFLPAQIFAGVLYLPWLPQLFRQLQSGINIDTYLPGWRQVLSLPLLKILPLTFFKLTAGRINFISPAIYLVYIVFVLGVVFFAFRLARHKRDFLFTWVLLPVFLMIAFSFLFPQNQPFRVIYILPGLILIFTQAIMRFPKLLITFFVYISLVGCLTYFTRPRLQREQWRQAITFIRSQPEKAAMTVVKFSDRFSPLSWYASGLSVLPAVPTFPAKPQEISRSLRYLSDHSIPQVILFDYLGDLTDPDREVDLALENLGYRRTQTFDFPGVGFIHLFIRI